jgi:DNA-binding beta-propeller fold protein YncE
MRTFRGGGAGGRGSSSLAALLVLLAVRTAAARGPDCLLAWRVPGGRPVGAGLVARCHDGDVTCDADGLADGTCTFAVGLCVDVGACAGAAVGSVRVGGRAGAAVARTVAELVYPVRGAEVCSAAGAVRVALGRRSRRRAGLWARAAAAAGVDRDRLTLVCERAAGGSTGGARAVVANTDFETGQLATVGLEAPHTVGHPPDPIHADAVVRVAGDRAYVVNRFLGDNIQVLDPGRGFGTVLQCSTVPGSNPHDIAVVDPHKAYVTRYDRAELWIVDPGAASCAGFRRGTVDLGDFADGDGLPEMDQMALVGDRLFVSVQRLDRRRGFVPAGKSMLVVIDTTTDGVIGAITLAGTNAFGDASGIAHEPGTGKLLVNEAGNIFRTGDGGIQRVDPFTLAAEDFLVTEDELGGNVTDFALVSPTKGYAVVITDALTNVLVAFDPTRRVVTRRLLARTDYLPDITLAPDATLWVADRNLPAPGIRIFDTADDRQLTTGVIDVGLPPFAIAFVP